MTEQNIQRQLLRIPTGWRQTSGLFTSAAEKLNQGLPGTNSTSGQNVLNLGSLDLKASTLTTGLHCILALHKSNISQRSAGNLEIIGLSGMVYFSYPEGKKCVYEVQVIEERLK